VGRTWITRETLGTGRPQESTADQVSVTSPPEHAGGAALNVELVEPFTRQLPLPPLLKFSELEDGIPPQSTVMLGGGASKIAVAVGRTWITRETLGTGRPQESTADQVSVTSPPEQAGGVALNVELAEPLTGQFALPLL